MIGLSQTEKHAQHWQLDSVGVELLLGAMTALRSGDESALVSAELLQKGEYKPCTMTLRVSNDERIETSARAVNVYLDMETIDYGLYLLCSGKEKGYIASPEFAEFEHKRGHPVSVHMIYPANSGN